MTPLEIETGPLRWRHPGPRLQQAEPGIEQSLWLRQATTVGIFGFRDIGKLMEQLISNSSQKRQHSFGIALRHRCLPREFSTLPKFHGFALTRSWIRRSARTQLRQSDMSLQKPEGKRHASQRKRACAQGGQCSSGGKDRAH